MDAIERLQLLSAQMHLEPAEDTGCPQGVTARSTVLNPRLLNKREAIFTSTAQLPNGRKINLLKTLQTSVCERNCFYCPFRSGRDFRRATFRPDEMAQTFMALHRGKVAEGIFLSSGMVNGGVYTQDQLLATAEILRLKMGFRGYLHLKLMPGSEKAQVERAMLLADRVSVNLEAPNTDRLRALAPLKEFSAELVQPLKWAAEIRRTQSPERAWNGRWPSTVTQFVVGAVGESDLELLSTTERLYRQIGLKRAYYSAFKPVEDTPLEDVPAEAPEREHRLYQASFLLRDYGFSLEEMPFDPSGSLPRDMDPKQAWAEANLAGRPTEINRASRDELLRIPGIGPKGAAAILQARRQGGLKDLSSLSKIGVNARRAAPYILVDGRQPAYQPALF